MVNDRRLFFLKLSFLLGTVADLLVGINWLLISLGYDVPNVISSLRGSGPDYRFAMYIGTMFMFGWTVILFWGYQRPAERRGLLMITAVLLLISILVELVFYQDLLSGRLFVFGVVLRLLIISKFSFSYFYSLQSRQAA